jgi:hypothetical protein
MDDQLEISKELELQITGAEKLSLWRLFGIQFILLPSTLGRFAPCDSHAILSPIDS